MEGLFDFIELIGKLKKTKRAGWVLRNVKQPESIADHMYRMALLSFLLKPSEDNKIDIMKCIKMSLVHDLAECVTGDITPHDNISKETKSELEREAMLKICGNIGAMSTEMFELWNEYEEGKTNEAKSVKDLDKFDMVMQAYEYEQEQGLNLQEFFDSTEGKFNTEQIKTWVDFLKIKRSK